MKLTKTQLRENIREEIQKLNEGNKDYYFHSKKTKNALIMVRDHGNGFYITPMGSEPYTNKKVEDKFNKLGVDGITQMSKKEGNVLLKKLRKDKDFYEDNS